MAKKKSPGSRGGDGRRTKRPVTGRKRKSRRPALLTPEEVAQERTKNWPALVEQRRKAESAFRWHHDKLLQRPDVCGLHIGFRTVDNQVAAPLEYAIVVHLTKIWPQDHPLSPAPLPTDLDGVPVAVLERTHRLATSSNESHTFAPTLMGGVAIALTMTGLEHWGTLGFVVYSGSEPRFLTNQHVVGNRGDVEQPPSGQTRRRQNAIIGRVVDSERNELVDCALIEPTGNRPFEQAILGAGTPQGTLAGVYTQGYLTAADEQVTRVFKVGAKTGFKPLQVGIVESVTTSVNVADFGTMINQISVASLSDEPIIGEGDSGSVLIARTIRDNVLVDNIVGLVFAETNRGLGLVANHFSNVASRLQISLQPV